MPFLGRKRRPDHVIPWSQQPEQKPRRHGKAGGKVFKGLDPVILYWKRPQYFKQRYTPPNQGVAKRWTDGLEHGAPVTKKPTALYSFKRSGRKRGQLPSRAMMLKDATLEAAIREGFDGNGKDGLIGFMRMMARDDLKAFASILGKIIPLQLETPFNTNVAYETVEQVQKEMEARGLTKEALLELADMSVLDIEHDPLEATTVQPPLNVKPTDSHPEGAIGGERKRNGKGNGSGNGHG